MSNRPGEEGDVIAEAGDNDAGQFVKISVETVSTIRRRISLPASGSVIALLFLAGAYGTVVVLDP